jgi:hypothetical protein
MKHRFGDQYARLESIRTYLRAALKLAKETAAAEAFAHDTPLGHDRVDEMCGSIDYALQDCQDMIDTIGTEAAAEMAEKDTLIPPAPKLDEPFKETP